MSHIDYKRFDRVQDMRRTYHSRAMVSNSTPSVILIMFLVTEEALAPNFVIKNA